MDRDDVPAAVQDGALVRFETKLYGVLPVNTTVWWDDDREEYIGHTELGPHPFLPLPKFPPEPLPDEHLDEMLRDYEWTVLPKGSR